MCDEDMDFCTVCATVTAWDGATCTRCGNSWGDDGADR